MSTKDKTLNLELGSEIILLLMSKSGESDGVVDAKKLEKVSYVRLDSLVHSSIFELSTGA